MGRETGVNRFDGNKWGHDRRQLHAVRLAALVCIAMSFAAIALKVVPLG